MPSLTVLADRDVHLTLTMDRNLVQSASDTQSFEPFGLPLLAHSQLAWMQTLGRRVFHNARRCFGLSLVLDTASGQWASPLVPYQRCRPDGVAWAFNPRELADLPPAWRLGGSFQTVDLGSDAEELAALVPPYDGLHIVAVNRSDPQVIATFLRHTTHIFGGGLAHQVTAIPWDQLIYDDWKQALDRCTSRMHVE